MGRRPDAEPIRQMSQDARPAVVPAASPATDAIGVTQLGGRRRKVRQARSIGGTLSLAAAGFLIAACSSGGAASTGSGPDTSGSRPAATDSALAGHMKKNTPNAHNTADASGTPTSGTTETGAPTQPDTTPTATGTPTPRTPETAVPTAITSASQAPTGENSCFNPSSADLAGLPWAGKQEVEIGPNNGVVFATEQNDPAEMSVTLPNGSTFTFGKDGSGYVAGFSTSNGPVTLIISGSGWSACEAPGSKSHPEPYILGQDVQSRRNNLVQDGFPGTTGTVINVSGNSVQQTVYSS